MKLAVGTAQFGMKYGIKKKIIKKEEIKKINSYLKKSKINLLDTAQTYGSAESIIGKNFSKNFNFITKIKIPKKRYKDILSWLSLNINNSIKKLKTKKIYGLLIHDYKDLKGKKGLLLIKNLKKLQKKGLIKKIGISIYNPKELDVIIKIFKPDIVQFPYNVLDQRIETSGWLNKLSKLRIETYARSCFLQGLLTNFQKDKKIYNKFKPYKKTLKKWFKWCKNNNISPSKACLHFVKSQRKIDYIVVGFDNFMELKDLNTKFKSKKILIPNIFSSNNINLIDPRKWYKQNNLINKKKNLR